VKGWVHPPRKGCPPPKKKTGKRSEKRKEEKGRQKERKIERTQEKRRTIKDWG